jgi:hypothetical protein
MARALLLQEQHALLNREVQGIEFGRFHPTMSL